MIGTVTPTPSNAGWDILNSSNLGRAKTNRFLTDKFPSRPIIQDFPVRIVNTTPSYYFAPPPKRTALKRRSKSRRPVSFCNSVDVRVSLVEPGCHRKRWYTTNEIQSMRATAMNKHSPLRHSIQTDNSKASQLQQDILSSPPPVDVASSNDHQASSLQPTPSIVHIPRAHSAAAQLHSIPSSKSKPNLLNIRYQQLISEMDREIFVRNEDRRNSTRRRLHHYCKVLDEIDRQVDEGYMIINVGELANASKMASGDVMVQALRRARTEATIAQAILLMGMR
eukprot:CAMPEP_0172314962 /NCGR_PEP_ID=MMETSP1058-20130122/23669_1 /TAXON_ID=83371 /ORGANISM="Detonula confervacea, Strain CCMP 353" /LENGTH=279 /DNA_ID=CAMNT_0013028925 /DNA_START=82 /DNA_END=918 /DNA_ORIENTATION=-